MVLCKCGKPIEKIPDWMQGVQADFVCNNCPNRQTKNIAHITLQPETIAATKLEKSLDDELELEGEADLELDAEPAP